MSRIMGIDPGLRGGVTIIDNGKIIYKGKMPVRTKNKEGKQEVDFNQIKVLLDTYKPDFVILEKASPRPMEGVVSAFTSGLNWGAVRTVCELHVGKDNLILVSPRVWASKLHIQTIEEVPDPKERSLNVVKKLFPEESFLGTVRSKIPHDGIVDSCLIAYWWIDSEKEFREKQEKESKKVSKKKTKKKGKKNDTRAK